MVLRFSRRAETRRELFRKTQVFDATVMVNLMIVN
jgi:hypothetical protein